MRKLAIITISLLLSSLVNAQLIDNKLNIYVGASYGGFMGPETTNENNYISPSLYSNYNSLVGFSIKGVANIKDYLSYGLEYNFLRASDWTSLHYSTFDKSKVNLHSITPLVRFHNKHADTGVFNKLKMFAECGPTIGISNLSLSKAIFEIQTSKNNTSPPMSENTFFAGLKGTVGLEYSIMQGGGLFLSYSYGADWVTSKLYNDNLLKQSSLNVGFIFKFKKNKYFYY